MNPQLWWYVARAGGIVALGLSGASVIWGLLLSSRIMQGRPRPAWLLDLHRFLGALTVVFTLVHVVALYLDEFVQFSVVDLLVPFASAWNTGAVAWGIIAMYLLVAIQLSSMLMKRIPRKLWKLIHMSSYGLVAAGVVHGAGAGTDATNIGYVGGVVGTIALIVYLTIYRIATARSVLKARKTSVMAAPSPIPAVDAAKVSTVNPAQVLTH